MKKYFVYFSVLSVLLVFGQALTSCIGDGDETISLEFASAKKMIVGRWKLSAFDKDGSKQSPKKFPFSNWKVVDTELTFYDDGTYYDSSDGGKKPHRWRLGPDGDNESKPYYGDIYLDDYEFDINSLGPGHWILGFDDDDEDGKPTWILTFDKDDSETVEPEPEPETEERYLVSSIKRDDSYIPSTGKSETSYYWFDYDDRGRVVFIKSNGNGKVFLQTSSFSYDDEKNEIIVNDRGSYFYGMRAKLSDGKIVQAKHPNMEADDFIYDKDDHLISARSFAKITWSKGNLLSISDYRSFVYSNEDNNANLDLNYFVLKESYAERYIWDAYIFGPLALYGKKSTNLLKYGVMPSVSRNDQKLPTTIIYKNYDAHETTLTLTIEYQKKTVLK